MARYDAAWDRFGPHGYDRPFRGPMPPWEDYGWGSPGGHRVERAFQERAERQPYSDGLYGPGRYGLGPYHERLRQRRRPDSELREEVEEALFYDTWVDAEAITVEVKDGVVTLRGELPSFEEVRYATDDAWDVDGVVGVRSELTVEG